MSKRKTGIQWKRSDYSRLSHKIKKVNEKIFAIQVKRPDIADIQPQMLDYKEVKGTITTRRELNLMLKRYDRYLRKGSEEAFTNDKGLRTTKFHIKERKIMERADNLRKKRERERLENLPFTIANKETAGTVKEMGKIKDVSMKESKKDPSKMSQDDFQFNFSLLDRKMTSMYTQAQRREMLKNYIRGLIHEGYSNKLQKLMLHIDINTFYDKTQSDTVGYFDFIYDPQLLKEKEEQLIEFWKEHALKDKNGKYLTNTNFNLNDMREEEKDYHLRIK